MFIGHEITHGFDNRGIFSVKDSAGIKVFRGHETEYIKLNEHETYTLRIAIKEDPGINKVNFCGKRRK